MIINNVLLKEYSELCERIERVKEGEPDAEAGAHLDSCVAARKKTESLLNGSLAGIIESITELYSDLVYRSADGKLYINGADVSAFAPNMKSPDLGLSVHTSAIRTAIAALAEEGISECPDAELLSEIFSHYNALVDILDCRKKLEAEARESARLSSVALVEKLEAEKLSLESDIALRGGYGAFLRSDSGSEILDYLSAIEIPIGITYVGDSEIPFPYYWEFVENGTLLLRTSLGVGADGGFVSSEACLSSETIDRMIESVILQFLASYPAGSKRLLVCDRLCSTNLISLVNDISKTDGCAQLFANCDDARSGCLVETDVDGVVRALSSLGIGERIATVSGDIFGYNEENPTNVQAPVLVILRGFISELSYSALSELRMALRSGADGGVYFLIVDTEEAIEKQREIIPEDALDLWYNHDYDVIEVIGNNHNNIPLDVEYMLADDFDRRDFLKLLSDAISHDENYIPFASLPELRADEEYSSVLNIPIGREGNETVGLSLCVDSPMAHCAITGMSGSGKSTLMHDIILGAARSYSPGELEMWIFDFKTGSELAVYEGLKHVKRMSLNNKSKDSSDLMRDILTAMRRRHEMMKAARVNNIADYNRKMRAESKPTLPRLLIFIDEYTEMRSPRCIADFESVALQGRSAGISLVISSVVYDSIFKNVLDQANHKIEFRTNRSISSLSHDSSRDGMFLRALKGNCLYSDGSVTRRIRVAYPGGVSEIEREIERINGKYPEFKYEKPLVAGSSFEAATEINSDPTEARELYRTKRRIAAPVGRTRDGEVAELIFGRERPRVILLGDEARCAGIELDVIETASLLSDREDGNVFYIDFYRSADRMYNPVADATERDYIYARSNRSIASAIRALYTLLKERETSLDNDDPIGSAVVVLLHGTEYLSERADAINSFVYDKTKAESKGALTLDEEAEAILASLTARDSDSDYEECLGVTSMLEKIVSAGARVRIYTLIHFENPKEMNSVMSRMLSYKSAVRDFVVAPPLADGDNVPASLITDYLAVAGAPTSDFERDGGLISSGELRYAFFVNGGVATRFIPYEK